ncbi:MAG: efflux RND transporter permease subunit, partial [Planctomycetota bacterium]
GFWLLLLVPFLVLGRTMYGAITLLAVFSGWIWKAGAMLCTLVLSPFVRVWQTGYGALAAIYPRFLRACLHQKTLVIFLALTAFGYAGWRATKLSPDLIPESLTGEFDVRISFAPGTPLEQTAARLRPIVAELKDLSEVEWVSSTVGVEADADRASDEGEHTAHVTVHLTEAAAHTDGTEMRVRGQVEQRLLQVPNILPPEFLPSTLFRFAIPLRVVFYGTGEKDLGRLSRASQELAEELRLFDGVDSVQVGLGRGAREVRLIFDRTALFRHELTVAEVAARIRRKLQGLVPTSLVEGSERTDVRVRLKEGDRSTLQQLAALNVSNPGKPPIPLGSILAEPPKVAEGPGEIRRVGGRHCAVVTASYKGFELGRLADETRAVAQPIAEKHGVEVDVAGRSREAKRSIGALLFAMSLAIFLVYAVMAAQFESLVQPLLIMISLPLAGVGAVLALDWLSMPLSVVVLLGAILLVGIAVNNAIVLLDSINRRIREKQHVRDAILDAARERLRPILMTTTTTVLGLLPMTGVLAGLPLADVLPFGLGGGEAAELRAPMAITVIGGLFTSTLLTLVLVPVLYELTLGRRGRGARAETMAGEDLGATA